MGWTRNLWNIGYRSLTTPTSFKSHKLLFNKRGLGWIYSNQKTINYIPPSNLRASVETRPPKLPNLLQFSPPSILDILWASPHPRASRGSAIHVFLVYSPNQSIAIIAYSKNKRNIKYCYVIKDDSFDAEINETKTIPILVSISWFCCLYRVVWARQERKILTWTKKLVDCTTQLRDWALMKRVLFEYWLSLLTREGRDCWRLTKIVLTK